MFTNAQIFSTEEIVPSAGQGIIALQCRNNDNEIISLLDKINDIETFYRAHAERNVLKILDLIALVPISIEAIFMNHHYIYL